MGAAAFRFALAPLLSYADYPNVGFEASGMADKMSLATLRDLLETGAPSRVAIEVPGGPSVTYGSLSRQVDSLAAHLASLGIGRGDRVITVLPNGIEAIISFLAVSTVATVVPLNPGYKADELRFFMGDAEHKALITTAGSGDVATKAAPRATVLVEASVDARGQVGLSAAGRRLGAGSYEPPAPDDVALMLYTSGTTSRPKRVALRHRNLTASIVNIGETYRLGPEDVTLCVMPLFHVHGLLASALATLFSGGTVVVPPRFDALKFWSIANRHNATWFSAVPTAHGALLKRAGGRGVGKAVAQSPSLRFIRSCSAPLSGDMMLEMEERFGVPVLDAYGMTEASHQMTSNPLPPGKRVPGTVGRGTGVSVAIMDDDGQLLSPGSRGEVVVKGPNVIDGYEGNPEADAASFTNGWFRTGDQGYLDSEGYLTLTGRLKEIINRSGEKISPLEIDEVLLSHPATAEAVSFGMSHPVHGEEPGAAVVLHSPATKEELIRHCRERLADFKVPRTIYIVDAIPRTATGKVQRRVVAEKLVGNR